MKSLLQLKHFDTGKQIDKLTLSLRFVATIGLSLILGVLGLPSAFAQANPSRQNLTAKQVVKVKTAQPKVAAGRQNQKKIILAQNSLPAAAPVAPNTSDVASGQSSAALNDQKAQAKNWGLSLGMDYQVSSVKEDAVEQDTSIEYTFWPTYKLSKDLSTSAVVVWSQQRTGAKETLLADTLASISYKSYYFTEDKYLRHSLTAILPTSKKSKEDDKLQGAVRVGNGVTLGFGSLFETTYVFGVQRNFHEFTVNRNGSPNVQWQLRHRLDLTLNLTESLSLTTWGLYTVGYTYENFNRYGFATDTSAELKLFKGLSISAGFSNDGSALKANGVDSNISAYDDKSSMYHAGMSYVF